jgi:FixJ family two-component response regulator/GAF domain-containing protein
MNAAGDTATKGARPCVLVVDDEPALLDLVSDVVGRDFDCRILRADSLRQAEELIRAEAIHLVLLDVNLPDGNGMSLLPALREHRPAAEAVVLTGNPSLDGAIGAMRAGVIDFLPKPFSADQLTDRVRKALERQAASAKIDKRLRRLRRAVRRLNVSRRMVSKKVDLLCNDLVAAYGELSKQVDGIRMQESFRKLIDSSRDLEQLLCHAMDWILRHAGYSNVAIWLAADDAESELGAYMKYTIAGEKPFTEAMKAGLLPLVQREGFVHLNPEDLPGQLTAQEVEYMASQTVLGANCTYLGETLATLIVFRDARSPFSPEDAAMLKAIAPIFATSLASVVRKHRDADDLDGGDDSGDDDGGDNDNDGDGGSPFYDDAGEHDDDDRNDDTDDADDSGGGRLGNRRQGGNRRGGSRRRDDRRERHSADWWKRGEPPPF